MKAVIRHIGLSPQSSCNMLLSRYGTAPVQVWIKRMTTIRGEQQMVITRGLHWWWLARASRLSSKPHHISVQPSLQWKGPGTFQHQDNWAPRLFNIASETIKATRDLASGLPDKTLRQIGTGAIFQSQAIHWNNSAMRIAFAEWSWKSAVQAKLAAATNQPFCPPSTPMVSPALL